MSRKIPNAKEMGSKGGKKTFRRIGPEGMAEIGAKGNEAIKKKYEGTDFFKERSKKAVAARLKKKEEKKKIEDNKKSPLGKLTSILTGN